MWPSVQTDSLEFVSFTSCFGDRREKCLDEKHRNVPFAFQSHAMKAVIESWVKCWQWNKISCQPVKTKQQAKIFFMAAHSYLPFNNLLWDKLVAMMVLHRWRAPTRKQPIEEEVAAVVGVAGLHSVQTHQLHNFSTSPSVLFPTFLCLSTPVILLNVLP